MGRMISTGRRRLGQELPVNVNPDLVTVLPPEPLPVEAYPDGSLPLTAKQRIDALCLRRPDLCAALCAKYPLANAFLRSGCATPQQMAGLGRARRLRLGQDAIAPTGIVTTEPDLPVDPDATEVQAQLDALETDLQETPATPSEMADYFARIQDAASGGIDWAVANPLLAIGVGLGLLMLLGGRRR